MSQLTKGLRFRDLVILGLLFIGPAAPVGLFGVLDAMTDGAVALVYIVATFVMSFTALSYARMSRQFPSAGSVYTYASAGINATAGFLVGWMLLLDYLFIPSVAFLFSGISLNSIFPSIPTAVFVFIAIFLITSLNLLGIKKSVKVTLVILIIEVFILLMVLAAGVMLLIQNGPQRDWLAPFTGGAYFEWKHLFAAVSIAVLSYLGFDAIAGFAEEAQGNRDAIGKAIISCLLLAGLLFVLQTYIAALISPDTPEYLRANPKLQNKNYYDIVNNQLGAWLGVSLAIMKGVGAAFAGMVAQAAASRLLFSMSRDNRLPKMLSKVGKSSGAPKSAILFSAFFSIILAGIAAEQANGLATLVSFVDVGALCAFIMLHISVIGYFNFKITTPYQRSPLLDLIIPIIGIIVLLPVLLSMKPVAQLVGGIWLLIGIVILLSKRWINKPSV